MNQHPEQVDQPRQTPDDRAGLGEPDIDDAPGSDPAGSPADELVLVRQKAAERDEYLELLQRVRADYANYQKRIQKEMAGQRRYAAQPLIQELLPVMDNLDRALQAADTAGNSSGLLDGIRMVQQQLLGVLARHGVQPIVAEGQPFDPAVHEAVVEEPSPDWPGHTVLRELERGYRLHDRVIRPTKVVVSRASAAPETSNRHPT